MIKYIIIYWFNLFYFIFEMYPLINNKNKKSKTLKRIWTM